MNLYPDSVHENDRKQIGWALDSVPFIQLDYAAIEARELQELRDRIARSQGAKA